MDYGKLIELLSEYVEKYNKSDLYYKFELENGELYCYNDVSDVLWTMQDEAMVICSKKFGFIQWLVDNDKIERDKKDYPLIYNSYYPDRFGIVSIGVDDYEEYLRVSYNEYETLLMLLSIQDNPIEFLCEILK